MDGGGKPAVFKQKKLKRGNLHILFIPLQHRQLAEKEHNDHLIMFSIPMGMKFISLEECLKKIHSTSQVSPPVSHKHYFSPLQSFSSYCLFLSTYNSKYNSVKQGPTVPQNPKENVAGRKLLLIACHMDWFLSS